MNSFYSQQELENIGFKKLGTNVLISRKVSMFGFENITIGSYVRIDDFCILSGPITLGSHIHISAYCGLYGSFGIEMEDYTGLSPRCTVFSASDDFSGNYLISPMVDEQLTNVTGGKVLIKRYSQVGAGCVILPDIIIEEGVAVGAMSLVNKTLTEWGIYAGIPAVRIKERNKGLLELTNK
jgi:galactoside O-acetyltransferase